MKPVIEEPAEKSSWERGLEKIEQGEERERERRNPQPQAVTLGKINLKVAFSDLYEFVRRIAEPNNRRFRQSYAAAMGEGDEEQWDVFV